MSTFYLSHLNWLAIAVAAFAYFILGALWYSLIFKSIWIRDSGINMNDPNAKKGAAGLMIFTFLLEFGTCVGLSILANKLLLIGGGVDTGVKLGLLTGVCFAAVAVAISYLYQMKSKSLIMIDCGYHIIGNIVAAIIICMWP